MRSASLFSVSMALTIMLVSACSKKRSNVPRLHEKVFNLSPFHSIYSADPVLVTIKKAYDYRITTRGAPEDLQRISFRIINGVLDIFLLASTSDPVELKIELPALDNLRIAGGATVFASGFGIQSEPLNIVCSGRSITVVDGIPSEVSVETGGLATLELAGITRNLTAQISADGKINGYALHSKKASIEISERGTARILVDSCINAVISGDARLYYQGNPRVSSFLVRDNGLVIHE